MSPRPALSKPIHRKIELDFIRGIAILMVMDFHAPRSIFLAPFLWLGFHNFGWAGVDIFFVLSGFLIGGLLVKEWKQYRRIDIRRFLIRRGFKIWPQYYVFLLANLLTGHRTLRQLWGNLLNIQNYVGGIPHTWTLAVEEHAYLLLVALLAFAARIELRTRRLFLSVGIACIVIVVWRLFLSYHGINTFTRTDGILYGLLLAMLYHFCAELLLRPAGAALSLVRHHPCDATLSPHRSNRSLVVWPLRLRLRGCDWRRSPASALSPPARQSEACLLPPCSLGRPLFLRHLPLACFGNFNPRGSANKLSPQLTIALDLTAPILLGIRSRRNHDEAR